jgi:DNA-binding response OmpR family regulator
MTVGSWSLLTENGDVFHGGRLVGHLTVSEEQVLGAIMARYPLLISGLALYEAGFSSECARTYVYRIRQKLGQAVITTDHKRGYRFNPEAAA